MNENCAVVIPLWNLSSRVSDIAQECVNTVEKLSPGAEIILIDNGSTERPVFHNKTTVTIKNDKNKGVGAAWNQGWKKTKREFVVFLNSDCMVHENWLAPLVNGMGLTLKGKPIGAISPVFARTKEDAQKLAKYSPDLHTAITGSCFMMRRELLKELKGFDEQYEPCYYEDADMWLRLKRHESELAPIGYALALTKYSSIHHYHHASCAQHKDGEKIRARNKEKFEKKWGKILKPHSGE